MITSSVLVMFGLGLACSVILAVASKLLAVEEDPRVEAVLEVLPAANCGGCGFAGCEGYAAAAVRDPNTPADRCCAGGAEVAAKVAELTGKAAGSAEPIGRLSALRQDRGQRTSTLRLPGPSHLHCGETAWQPRRLRLFVHRAGRLPAGLSFRRHVHGPRPGSRHPRQVHGLRHVRTGVSQQHPRDRSPFGPGHGPVLVPGQGQGGLGHLRGRLHQLHEVPQGLPRQVHPIGGGVIRIDHAACIAYGPSCLEACAEKCPRGIIRRLEGFAAARDEAA